MRSAMAMFLSRVAFLLLTPYGIVLLMLLLTLSSAFWVLNVTNKTRIELHKKEQLVREYESLLEERDNLYLEKEVLSDSVRIELLAIYELNMRPIQPSDNVRYLTQ